MFYFKGQTLFLISFLVAYKPMLESCKTTHAILYPGSFSTLENFDGNCRSQGRWAAWLVCSSTVFPECLRHLCWQAAGVWQVSIAGSAVTARWRQLQESYRGTNASGESLLIYRTGNCLLLFSPVS